MSINDTCKTCGFNLDVDNEKKKLYCPNCRETELWRSFVDDKPITAEDVDNAIELALSEYEEKTVLHKWISHPKFKEYIIEQGKHNQAYPYTLITEIEMASGIEEMQDDLRRWNKL
jgi:hypothetical protein